MSWGLSAVGLFGNDAAECARIFWEVLHDYQGDFEEICFAIPNTVSYNYIQFNNYFSDANNKRK